jgi:Glycosyl transferase family 2
VTDHSSTDRTPGILAEYAQNERVHVDRDEGEAHDQVSRINRLTRIADESHGADWIIHCDADEFWLPAFGSLRDVFAAVPDSYGYLIVERTNFVPLADDERPFHQRMTVRERCTLNIRGEVLEPKVAQRPRAGAGVTAGNHDLEDPVMERAPDIGAVAVGHFPMRSFEQFERKVVNTGTGYERLEGRGEGVGGDQLELLRIQRSGGLRDYYDARTLDQKRVGQGLESGEFLADERVRTVLGEGWKRPEESQQLQDVLRHVWLAAGSIDRGRVAAEDSVRELERAVVEARHQADGARAEAEQLTRTLAAVRASRIMRYTASARRAYYRVRRR